MKTSPLRAFLCATIAACLIAQASAQAGLPCECYLDVYSCLVDSKADEVDCSRCGWCNGVCFPFVRNGSSTADAVPESQQYVGGAYMPFEGQCTKNFAFNCTSSGLATTNINVTLSTTDFSLTSVGVLLAICGNLVTAVSLSLQKFVHNKIEKATGAGLKPRPYYCTPQWWLAIVLMLTGELGNAGAYSIAPASTISPVGGVSVVFSTIIAIAWLKEKFRWIDLMGLLSVVAGVVLVILFGPSSNKTITIETFRFLYVAQLSFIIYLIAMLLVVLILFLVARKYADKHILILIGICSICGSIAVVVMKAFITFLISVFSGGNPFVFADFYILAIFGGFMGFMQIRHLNSCMQLFGNLQTIPIYYTTFTVMTIVTANVLFNEFGCGDFCPQAPCIILFAIGCGLGFIGVFLVSAKSGGFLLRKKGAKWADNPVMTQETVERIRRKTQIFIGKLPIAALRRRSTLAAGKAKEDADEIDTKEVEVEVEVVVEEDESPDGRSIEMTDFSGSDSKEVHKHGRNTVTRVDSARLPGAPLEDLFAMWGRRRGMSHDRSISERRSLGADSDDISERRKMRIREVRIKQASFDFDRDSAAPGIQQTEHHALASESESKVRRRKPTHRRVISLPVHAEAVILREITRDELQRNFRRIENGRDVPQAPLNEPVVIYEDEYNSPRKPVANRGGEAMSPVSEKTEDEVSEKSDTPNEHSPSKTTN